MIFHGNSATCVAKRALPGHQRVCFALLACCCWCGLPSTASAVTVLLESGQTVRGVIVLETAIELVIDELDSEGKKQRRKIAMDDVAAIRRPVNDDRLATLKPDQPNEYRLYAEELAEKHADPEARRMALRLYLIAAHLSPADLGRPCLLGMASIAQSPAEAKRYRGMAYLLDGGRDPRLLHASQPGKKTNAPNPNPKTLHVIRLLRSGERSDAFKLVEADDLLVGKLEALLPPEHAKAVLSRVCIHCTKGYVPCPRCRGTGETAPGDPCPACRISRTRSRGKLRCPTCSGKYGTPEMTKAQLVALVKAEFQLAGGIAVGRTEKTGWQHPLAEEPAARTLDLRTITEYDPTHCVYRNKRWVAP